MFFITYSGLKSNLDKSDILLLGLYRKDPTDVSDMDIIGYITNPVRLLGCLYQFTGYFEHSYVPWKLEKLKEIFKIWSMKDLIPIGKITCGKSLGISQSVFLLSVLPKPPDKFLKNLNSAIFNFIWSGKPDKISRNTIIGDYEKGCLKIIIDSYPLCYRFSKSNIHYFHPIINVGSSNVT